MLAGRERLTFGFDLLDAEPTLASLVEESFPFGVVETSHGRFETTTVAPSGRAGAVQILRIVARERIVGPSWGGAFRLARAEYTQLTPGGPLAPAPAHNVTGLEGDVLWIDDRGLDAAAAVAQWPSLALDSGDAAVASLAIAFGPDRNRAIEEARALARDAPELAERTVERRRRLWGGFGESKVSDPVRRGFAYAVDCAAARFGDAVAILADHQILPLVWTRDAYYVCRALLASADPHALRVVEDFVHWMFDVAERVRGWWPRASLASGRAKDPVFQLDQQLWPLLLVADHARLSRDLSVRARYEDACATTIEALLDRRSAFGLIATDENPADDPVVQPYHFSSHVLLWRVLEAFGHPAAAEVRDATLRHFTVDRRFAYALTGPQGQGARHYHDANDLPTVFAPGWGFCAAENPIWRATIDFAWTPANDGFFDGRLGGLGSLHTRHPWPLGDLQEVIVARVLEDRARESRALGRLERVETWDGLLPEAYDEASGAVASRHWFAWPAALRAVLVLDPMLTAP